MNPTEPKSRSHICRRVQYHLLVSFSLRLLVVFRDATHSTFMPQVGLTKERWLQVLKKACLCFKYMKIFHVSPLILTPTLNGHPPLSLSDDFEILHESGFARSHQFTTLLFQPLPHWALFHLRPVLFGLSIKHIVRDPRLAFRINVHTFTVNHSPCL